MLFEQLTQITQLPAKISHAPKHRARELASGLLLLGLVLSAPMLRAETTLELDGFASVGGGKLDDDSINQQNRLTHNEFSEDTEFDRDSRVAIQLSAWFDNDVSLSAQAISDGAEDYDPALEWAYVGYDVNQNIKFRLGRMRRPLYSYSDYLQVGYAYPWIRPPVEVYSRDLQFFDGIDAIDVLYQAPLSDWNFSTQAYYGQSSGDAEVAKNTEVEFRSRDDFGLVFNFDRDWLNLRLGYHKSPSADIGQPGQLSQLVGGVSTAGFESTAEALRTRDIDVDFYTLGVNVDTNDWIGSFEYINVQIDTGLGNEERSWYLMAGRRIGPYTLHLTYADRDRDNQRPLSAPIYAAINQLAPGAGDPRVDAAIASLSALASGVDQAVAATNIQQHSYTLGLRYNFQSPASIKVEYQRIFDDRQKLTNNLVSFVIDFLF
ncbi:MAG: hypothetical protein ACI9KN_002375 [Gammaproteobacteria bacterium]|jgi:hypothetical protein